MSYGSPPPPGDDRPDPTGAPEERPDEGYGSPQQPPPQYGSPEPPPAAAPPPAGPPPGTSEPPPPPPAGGGYAPPPPAEGGYGAPPPAEGGYGAPPPPPPAYGQQGYGAAPTYAGPYEQGSSVGTLALWPQRALGWLVDFILLAIPGWILYWIGAPKTTIVGNTIVQSGPGFAYYLGALYILALYIYNRWYRGGTTGYTIGRGLAGVKLVKESTGETIGMGMAFVRDIAHIVDSIICYVGWLFPLWDVKRQTIADKIMSTVVLLEPQPKKS
jgi:RDD family